MSIAEVADDIRARQSAMGAAQRQPQKVSTMLRLTPELMARLDQLAKESIMSRNALMVALLDRAAFDLAVEFARDDQGNIDQHELERLTSVDGGERRGGRG